MQQGPSPRAVPRPIANILDHRQNQWMVQVAADDPAQRPIVRGNQLSILAQREQRGSNPVDLVDMPREGLGAIIRP